MSSILGIPSCLQILEDSRCRFDLFSSLVMLSAKEKSTQTHSAMIVHLLSDKYCTVHPVQKIQGVQILLNIYEYP